MSSPEELEMEALKTLHDGYLKNLHALSERPFHAVFQAVTLNVAVVAGLVAGAVTLSLLGKALGTVVLVMFNILVIAHICRQGCLYREEKERYQNMISCLRGKCPSLAPQASTQSSKCRYITFLTGTKLFVATIAIAAFCSIVALWCPLGTTRDSLHSANFTLSDSYHFLRAPGSGRPGQFTQVHR